jgi:putative endonuclease
MSAPPSAAFALASALRKRRRKKSGATRKTSGERKTDIVLSPTQKQGQRWEDKAADFLQQQGLGILARNLRCKAGEIDLIAMEPDGTLVFIEVRQRSLNSFGRAADTVNHAKQQRLVRAAHFILPLISARFLHSKTPACRFDVMGYDGAELIWLKAAFHT